MTERVWTALEWREMGGQLMLVSCEGGAKVALCARGSMIHTRDPELGIIRLLRPDDEIAVLAALAPELAHAGEAVIAALQRSATIITDQDVHSALNALASVLDRLPGAQEPEKT